MVAQIVEHIKDGELDEGDALPGERQLATQMEVSRRTIRQAIGVLAEAGVLSVQPGPSGGIRVRSIWLPAEIAEQGVALSPDGVIEVLEARRTIEPRVAELAALRATDTDFAAMRSAIELQRNVASDRDKLNQANALFHRAMLRSARNSALEAAMRLIWDSLEVALDMTSRTDTDHEDSLRLHEETLAALRKGKPNGCGAAMEPTCGTSRTSARTCWDAISTGPRRCSCGPTPNRRGRPRRRSRQPDGLQPSPSTAANAGRYGSSTAV